MSSIVSTAASFELQAMNGPEKVAALLLAMGKPLASRLLKHFNPTELKMITRSAAALGAVSVGTLEALVEDLAAQFSRGVDLRATAAEVEHLLGDVLPPDQVAEIMSEVMGSSNSSTWVRLSSLPERELADYISKEHPQTAALILTRLTSETAAKVLGVMPRERRNALARRMLSLRPVSDGTIHILETKLRDDLLTNADRNPIGRAQARVADILNRLPVEQAEDVLVAIAEVKPEDAAQLRTKMFSFNDVVMLSAKARSILFDKVASEQIVLALRGTDAAFRDAVLSTLGARARRLVENELNSGAAAPKDIAVARKAISSMVLDLVERGEIDLENDMPASL